MRIRHLFAFIASTLFLHAGAQTDSQFGVALHAGVSHSGWNIALVGQYRIQNFQAYAGPSVSLNRGLPAPMPLGLNAGGDFFIPTQRTWLESVINLDYQLHPLAEKDLLHEMHLSYGLKFQTPSGFFVVQQLGYGLFLENVFLESTGKRKTFSGYDGLVRLRAGYQF